jgi:para-aminobenzoate synthetase/4-amino-4-deoxychorismate lyase
MAASASRFGFVFDGDAFTEAVRCAGDGRVRVSLSRDGGMEVATAAAPPADAAAVRLSVDHVPVRSDDILLFHKSTRRQAYDERRSRHPEADDVLLVNERGEVTEATVANLAYRLDGRWWTPPLDAGCLPGIGREVLVEEGVLAERPLPLTDLSRVDAVALVSSLRGWRPAVLLPQR